MKLLEDTIVIFLAVTILIEIAGGIYVLINRSSYKKKLKEIIEALPPKLKDSFKKSFSLIKDIEESKKFNEHPKVKDLKLEAHEFKIKYKRGLRTLGVAFVSQVLFLHAFIPLYYFFCDGKGC